MVDVYTRVLAPEGTDPHPELGFGRHIEHDPRSKKYPVKTPLLSRWFPCVTPTVNGKSLLWEHPETPLDQGELGSCTGNAATHLLGTQAKGRDPLLGLTEDDAVSIYKMATRIDEFPGEYPPTDTGSSGLAVMKVLRNLKYIKGYSHAFGLTQTISALQKGPAIMGITWREDMYYPDSSGYVSYSGPVVGGHEVCIIGVDTRYEFFTVLNSWGPSWGQNGRFKLTFADMRGAFVERADVTAPVW